MDSIWRESLLSNNPRTHAPSILGDTLPSISKTSGAVFGRFQEPRDAPRISGSAGDFHQSWDICMGRGRYILHQLCGLPYVRKVVVPRLKHREHCFRSGVLAKEIDSGGVPRSGGICFPTQLKDTPTEGNVPGMSSALCI